MPCSAKTCPLKIDPEYLTIIKTYRNLFAVGTNLINKGIFSFRCFGQNGF